jgi:manganese transport protein
MDRAIRENDPGTTNDSRTIASAQVILSGNSKKGILARLLPFLGPAFVASVGYMDPGNFATNIQSGARFGYLLLWVVVFSSLMAMLIQTLSAKLGIATGMNLAELCRAHFPRRVTLAMWVIMELVVMATDLAEFLGASLALYLLFGIPLLGAALITAVITFLILGLERYGFRPLEAVISAMVFVVAVCYLAELLIGKPDWAKVLANGFVPRFSGAESVFFAAGILGATVMPHTIFLHSALTQGRIVTRDAVQMKRLFRYEVVDVVAAMSLAAAINCAMLIMAAATFHASGLNEVGSIEEAYRTLEPLLGTAAGIVFAVSLLASGLSSSSVGTMAGQVIMQGFLHRKIQVWIRRLVTILPALAVIGAGLDPTYSMVVSQVVLSFGLPFAIIPLLYFTSSRKIMGIMTNHPVTTAVMSVCALLVLSLNFFLLYQTFFHG